MIECVHMLKKMVMGVVIALSSVVLGSEAHAAAPLCPDKNPQMTIVMYNNSGAYNVYPVLSFPGAGIAGKSADKWLQGCFGVPQADIKTKTYPSASDTRMFVNCCGDAKNGIKPGGAVTITLPLYSPVVDKIDPTKAGQLIEWWQGGNINFYQSTDGKPPPALLNLWNDSTKKPLRFPSGRPTCPGETTCTIYSVRTGNPVPEDPQQLVEFTLGAAPINPDRAKSGQPFFLFDPKNVDYDVSYVNTAYLPVVMEAFGNKLQGWVGAPGAIATFHQTVDKFLTSDLAKGWPLFIGKDGKVVPRKVPSALEIFAGSLVSSSDSKDGTWFTPAKLRPAPAISAPIQAMIKRWTDCQPNQPGMNDPICKFLNDNTSPKNERNDATSLIRANFSNYLTYYSKNGPKGDWGCDQTKTPHPAKIPMTHLQLLQHIYGWQPFNEHCGGGANQFYDTPGWNNPKNTAQNYQLVKNGFDKLQYWRNVLERKYGVFHPFVALIHGPDYLNAPYTYAYSVDDAVGNVQTDGTGLYIAVGGTQRLPNPDHATPDVHFDFGYKNLANGIFFTKFGRCETDPEKFEPVNPNFTSFAVPIGVTQKVSDCPIGFKDSKNRIYYLQLSADPKLAPDKWVKFHKDIAGDLEARKPVQASCDKNKNQQVRDNWCKFAFAFQMTLNDARQTIEYHVNMRAPPD